MVRLTLDKVMRERKMTQAQLAKESGIDPASIYRLLRGQQGIPFLKLLDTLCKALKCDINELIKND